MCDVCVSMFRGVVGILVDGYCFDEYGFIAVIEFLLRLVRFDVF